MTSWILFMVTLLVSGAPATSFLHQPFTEAVQEAPVIARGKVGMSYADWVQLDHGVRRIHTFTELQVEEVLKGSIGPASIMMRELGGEKDGKGMQVSGTARFTRGDDVVVFLNPTSDSSVFQVKGMMMGRLDVERGNDGEEYLSGPAISGADEHGHGSGESRGERGERWSLTRLRELVREQEAKADSPRAVPTNARVERTSPRSPPPFAAASPEPGSHEPAPRLQSPASDSPGAARRWGWLVAALVLAPGIAWIIRRSHKR